MPNKLPQPNRSIERRLAALEKSVDELRKIVGDLKYEIEQMREE
ncbi:MAG TPA: hypothetical protein VH439_08105 [Gemmatimonadales bacterium]|jgi:hypothetical protein